MPVFSGNFHLGVRTSSFHVNSPFCRAPEEFQAPQTILGSSACLFWVSQSRRLAAAQVMQAAENITANNLFLLLVLLAVAQL